MIPRAIATDHEERELVAGKLIELVVDCWYGPARSLYAQRTTDNGQPVTFSQSPKNNSEFEGVRNGC